MYKISFSEYSLEESQEAIEYYEEIRTSLAEEFKDYLLSAVSKISNTPYHYQIHRKNIRKYPAGKFPFNIFYIVNDKSNEIVIVSIFHASRNPKIIQKRIKFL